MRHWSGHAWSEYSNKGQVVIGWYTLLWFTLTDMIFLPLIFDLCIFYIIPTCSWNKTTSWFGFITFSVMSERYASITSCRPASQPASHITCLYYVWFLSLYVHKIGNRIIIKQSCVSWDSHTVSYLNIFKQKIIVSYHTRLNIWLAAFLTVGQS